jgi:hypothetical protein
MRGSLYLGLRGRDAHGQPVTLGNPGPQGIRQIRPHRLAIHLAAHHPALDPLEANVMTLFLLIFAALTYLAIAALIGRCWPLQTLPLKTRLAVLFFLVWPFVTPYLLRDAMSSIVDRVRHWEQFRNAIGGNDASR